MKTDETMVDVVPWFVFRGIAFGHKIIPGTWGTRYIESVPGIRKQLVETFNMAVQEYVCRREMSGRLVFFWKILINPYCFDSLFHQFCEVYSRTLFLFLVLIKGLVFHTNTNRH